MNWQHSDVPETLVYVDKDILYQNKRVEIVSRVTSRKVLCFSSVCGKALDHFVMMRLMDIIEIDSTLAHALRVNEEWTARRNSVSSGWIFVKSK